MPFIIVKDCVFCGMKQVPVTLVRTSIGLYKTCQKCRDEMIAKGLLIDCNSVPLMTD